MLGTSGRARRKLDDEGRADIGRGEMMAGVEKRRA
jgi:hypothetical protein